MFGRLMVALAAVLLVAGMAALPDLAKPAVGAAAATRVGSVFPSTLTPGGTARFCGSGFAPGVPVDVMVGSDSAQGVTSNSEGGFCLDLRAMAGAEGAAKLLAVGRTADGALLKVVGAAKINAAAKTATAVGPLTSASRPIVLQLWIAAAALTVFVGLVAISVQRRRLRLAPVSATSSSQE